MNDTPQEIVDLMRVRLMSFSGAERVAMGSRMFDAARDMVLASLPAGLSAIEIKGQLCERIYGQEVDTRGFVAHLTSIERRRISSESADHPPDSING